ncbi:insulin-like growth factor II isoform X1 [Callorhinchus milii]|uniref:Insulin-like growth factor 2 n=2 Tax=Callorhinchus milii TaxID=7868 RepID=V9KWC6_CALMI|nr:insulin-like growth factor II isoform X1 [Callorhinchus milii]
MDLRTLAICPTCADTAYNHNSFKGRKMSPSRRLLFISITLTVYIVDGITATETLCGGELVDTLQFVCGERGFYFSRATGRANSRRQNRGIVEECCFRSCDLNLLELYCAKPVKKERDLSATPFHLLPSASKESFRKPLAAKYSKYDFWQKKSAQRLRRGIAPSLAAQRIRRQFEEIQSKQRVRMHKPLLTLPAKPPLEVRASSEKYFSRE